MHRPPEDIGQLRERGLPWLAAVTVLIILLITAGVIYLLLEARDARENEAKAEETQRKQFSKENAFMSRKHPMPKTTPVVNIDIVPILSKQTGEIVYPMIEKDADLPSVQSSSTVFTAPKLSSEIPSTITSTQSSPTTISTVITSTTPESSLTVPPTSSSTKTPNFFNWTINAKDLKMATFPRATVISSNPHCTHIARKTLWQRGNALDSAVAGAACLSALEFTRNSPGGGNLFLIHSTRNHTTTVINGLEAAPQAVTENFYKNEDRRRSGYPSIATPGWLAGLWKAYQKFGSKRLEWKDLILPTVELMIQNPNVSSKVVDDLREISRELQNDENLRSWIQIAYGKSEPDLVLAEFFRKIATSINPMQQFYRGEIANKIVDSMRTEGGLITKADLVNYDARLEVALEVQICNKFLLNGPKAPSMFPLLLAAIKVMCEKFQSEENLEQNENYFDDILKIQRIIDNLTLDIGDPYFDVETREFQESLLQGNLTQIILEKLNEPMDTVLTTRRTFQDQPSNEFLSVVDMEGNIVVYSATLNSKRGSMARSKQYGFLWNNAMSEFNLSGGKEIIINTIQGKKRPRSLLMPLILIDQQTNEVILINADFTEISIAQLLQIILNKILLKKSPGDAIAMGRLYSSPQGSTFDSTVPLSLVSKLSSANRSMSPRLSNKKSTIALLIQNPDRSLSGLCNVQSQDYCSQDGF